jgi:hypothetical protein
MVLDEDDEGDIRRGAGAREVMNSNVNSILMISYNIHYEENMK